MSEMMAPGHAYVSEIGSGIAWEPGQATLWLRHEVLAVGQHDTASARAFWETLAFARTFPQVTHWWFRSAWTHQARVSRAVGMYDEATPYGYIQFIDDQEPGNLWMMSQRDYPMIDIPYPPLEAQPVNIPLRLALARLLMAVVTHRFNPDTWCTVTSLVATPDLEVTFPTTHPIPTGYGGFFQLSNGEEPLTTPLRQHLCDLMGL
jgi:hypothetical protein